MEGTSDVVLNLETSLTFSQTRFLVVGGNGYFGYKLVEALVGKGAQLVRVLDRQQTHFLGCPEVDFVVGDICDAACVSRAVAGVDVVFHTASYFGDPAFGSFGNGDMEWRVNVEGTRNVINALQQQQKQQEEVPVRLVYFGSSSSVFNGSVALRNAPDDLPYPTHHVDHYGRCKAVAEQEVMQAHDPDRGLATCVLRPNGIYGEHEIIHIPRVVRMAKLFFSCLPAYFDPTHLSDWTFVDNLIFASFLAADKLAKEASLMGGKVYNITDGEPLGQLTFSPFFSQPPNFPFDVIH